MAAAAGAQLRARFDGPAGPPPRFLEVARKQPFVVADHRQPGVNRRFVQALQELLSSLGPAAHGGHEGGVEEQVHGDPDRRACCRETIARRRLCAYARSHAAIVTSR